MESQDTITIAPSVLISIARYAAAEVNGVAGTGVIPIDVMRVLKGSPMGSGVVLDVDGQKVAIDIYLHLVPNVNIREVCRTVQESIQRAIKELVGMEVTSINAHVEDVEFPANLASARSK